MSQEGSLAENGSHALCGGGADAACKLIKCQHLNDGAIEACQNQPAVQEMRQRLSAEGFSIEGMSVRCVECGTLNGHGSCSKRFGSICVNQL